MAMIYLQYENEDLYATKKQHDKQVSFSKHLWYVEESWPVWNFLKATWGEEESVLVKNIIRLKKDYIVEAVQNTLQNFLVKWARILHFTKYIHKKDIDMKIN